MDVYECDKQIMRNLFAQAIKSVVSEINNHENDDHSQLPSKN